MVDLLKSHSRGQRSVSRERPKNKEEVIEDDKTKEIEGDEEEMEIKSEKRQVYRIYNYIVKTCLFSPSHWKS